ncbi:MAG: PAS domain S-box protein, partial [Firmicutes bacterium]|nr:PAS domain S-box protein [Bacillota bacterium]
MEPSDRRILIFLCLFLMVFTSSKVAFSALPDCEYWVHAFQQHSAVAFVFDGKTGVIVHGNEAAFRYYGYSQEEFIGMDVHNINALPPLLLEEERLAALRGEKTDFMFPHVLANGEVRLVEVSASPVGHDTNLVLSIVRDVTESTETEERLLRQNAQLRRAEMIT